MPHVLNKHAYKPLWKRNEEKAKRNGPHRTVYYPDGSTYRGEWKDDKRQGWYSVRIAKKKICRAACPTGRGLFKSPRLGYAYNGRNFVEISF